MDILKQFRELESDLVERKPSAVDLDKVRQAVCAFANDLPGHRKPGVVLIGQNDDGTCSNLKIDDELLLRLAHIRGDGEIQSFPAMNVSKETLGGCDVAAIVDHPSENTPVRLLVRRDRR